MRCSVRRFRRASAVIFVLAALGTRFGIEVLPVAAAQSVFRPPTTALVLDPFGLPNGPYAAGNRGIEYDTHDGDVIVAAAAGEVVFAGAVARSLFLTVDHGGGLKSTYGFVAHLLVTEGDMVRSGDEVAVAGGAFHFGARLHGDYIDPATLFGVRETSVRLVPHVERPDPAGGGSADDRVAAIEWAQAEQARDAGRMLMIRMRSALRPTPVGAGLAAPPATLLDGPTRPRTASGRRRRKHHNLCPTRSPRRPARELNREEGAPWQSSR